MREEEKNIVHSIKLPNLDFKDRALWVVLQTVPYASKICVHAVENSNFSLVENDDDNNNDDDDDDNQQQ